MRRAGILALGAWMLLTAAALVVSWLGVGAVTRAVSASPQPVIPHASLAGGQIPSGPAQLAAPTTTTPTTAPTTTTLSSTAPPTPVHTNVSTHSPAPAPTTPTTTTPTTTSVAGSSPTSTEPVTSGTSPPQESPPATYSSPGGQATVRCTGDEISLVNAFPANGYQLKVDNGGPKIVTVSFTSTGAEYQISAVCQNGSPVPEEGGDSGNTQGTEQFTTDQTLVPVASETQDSSPSETQDSAPSKTQDSSTGQTQDSATGQSPDSVTRSSGDVSPPTRVWKHR